MTHSRPDEPERAIKVRGDAGAPMIDRLRTELNRSLFVPPPPDAFRFRGREGAAVLVAFLLLAGGLELLRAGPADAVGSLFAEDGPVYLGGALSHGFWDSVTSTYAEYLVVIPRLLGEVGAAVPLRYAPEAMNLGSLLIVGLSGVAVWFGSAGLVRSAPLRALLVLLLLLSPTSGLETVVSPTNTPWYTSFAVFWLLLWRPETGWGAGLGAAMIFLSGLSTPAAFFFLPLAVLRAVAIENRRDALVAGSFFLSLAIQLPATALSGEQYSDHSWTANLLTTFLQRVVEGAVLGLELGGEAWVQFGWPLLIAICLGLAGFLLWLWLRARSGRLFAAIAVATAVAMFFASGYQRSLGPQMVWLTGTYDTLGGRYAMIPGLLLAGAAIVLADAQLRSRPERRWPAVATAAVLAVAMVTSFGGDAGRQMPSWSQSLRTAAAECRTRGLEAATVRISPKGWTMSIPCERLESEYPPRRA